MKSIQNKYIFIGIINALAFLARVNPMQSYKQEKSWTYDFKSIESTSSNEDMLKVDLRVERVSRGVFSMSGTFTMNYDVVEDDDNELELTVYRSDNGIDGYKILPFNIQRQHFFSFFNAYYKDMAMESLKDCSNMPQFEDKFVPPFEKKIYTMSKCQISQDGYPQYMQDGFYKVVIMAYGTVDWSITVFVEVQQKM